VLLTNLFIWKAEWQKGATANPEKASAPLSLASESEPLSPPQREQGGWRQVNDLLKESLSAGPCGKERQLHDLRFWRDRMRGRTLNCSACRTIMGF
jgi:hypothetical protein